MDQFQRKRKGKAVAQERWLIICICFSLFSYPLWWSTSWWVWFSECLWYFSFWRSLIVLPISWWSLIICPFHFKDFSSFFSNFLRAHVFLSKFRWIDIIINHFKWLYFAVSKRVYKLCGKQYARINPFNLFWNFVKKPFW